ncbi:hypothetical protein R3P38DRAFT_2985522 [Favolaschia claudopus]|uniref:F-box domain-containing protein n=1 Tax=Favolaschia claudopus TaxID=2862362 RepID=A0AAW0AYJ1_9AGAR
MLIMDPPNPLKIQELLEQCISFLSHSPPDLLSCALVARPWVQPAQSELFRAPQFYLPLSSQKFLDSVRVSPHLVAYVHELDLNFDRLRSVPTFHDLCAFSFPHLEVLYLTLGMVFSQENPLPHVHQMQRLLASPKLRYAFLDARSAAAQCADMLTNISPTIEHLSLYGGRWTGNPALDTANAAPICLKSVRLIVSDFTTDFTWPTNSVTSFPFDLSNLQALAISGRSTPWDVIPTANIRILSLDHWGSISINLASFPCLQILVLEIGRWFLPDILETLKTLSPHHNNKIHTIVLSISWIQARGIDFACPLLDAMISSLTMKSLQTVEIKYTFSPNLPPSEIHNNLEKSFPKLKARNLSFRTSVCYPELGSKQWKELVERL